MNKEFQVGTRARRATNAQFEIVKSNGWLDAYKEISGDRAYGEGFAVGFQNGFTEGCHSLWNHMKFIISRDGDMNLSEFVKLIKQDTK